MGKSIIPALVLFAIFLGLWYFSVTFLNCGFTEMSCGQFDILCWLGWAGGQGVNLITLPMCIVIQTILQGLACLALLFGIWRVFKYAA